MKVKIISKTVGVGDLQEKSLEDIIVYNARVSSSREDKLKDGDGLLRYCIENQHWSIFEHGYLTMEIETSKAIGIQLLRHRSFTFQEFSQRYQDVSKLSNGGIFEDVEIRKQAVNNRQSSEEEINPEVRTPWRQRESDLATVVIEEFLEDSNNLYKSLLESGVAREQARMVLPMATKTRIYMTGSVRSWIHFVKLRDDRHAQKEVQEVAKAIRKILTKELPIIAKALKWI